MIKPKLLKKRNDIDIETDITRAFNLLSKREKLYHITIQGLETHHTKDLQFIITNKLFNTIHKDCKNTFEYIDYLFVIEYGGIISKRNVFNSEIEDFGIHCHCIVNTSLPKQAIEFYLSNCFKKTPNYRIDDFSKSTTKENLLNYLLKQNKTGIMIYENYNYKIVENRIIPDYFKSDVMSFNNSPNLSSTNERLVM